MSDWMPPVIVGYCTADAPTASSSLIHSLGIPLEQSQPKDSWVLRQRSDWLELVRPDGVCMSVDFTAGKTRHRTKEAGSGAAPMKKALGVSIFRKRHGRLPDIIDATGGWGQDAWAMASLGCQVTIIEQHPIVHALLANALARAGSDDVFSTIAKRINLDRGDAKIQLGSLQADAIYLDPMYPVRERKKADSKKGMQFLHALLGPSDEDDSAALLSAALAHAAQRVIVKRPKAAAALASPASWAGQHTFIESPNTRYDVYIRHTA